MLLHMKVSLDSLNKKTKRVLTVDSTPSAEEFRLFVAGGYLFCTNTASFHRDSMLFSLRVNAVFDAALFAMFDFIVSLSTGCVYSCLLHTHACVNML